MNPYSFSNCKHVKKHQLGMCVLHCFVGAGRGRGGGQGGTRQMVMMGEGRDKGVGCPGKDGERGEEKGGPGGDKGVARGKCVPAIQ